MSTIPKIIHLISPGQQPPAQYDPFIAQMKALHPLWRFIIWDDSMASAVVAAHFPDWKYYYDRYSLPVQRADIFRAMVVYLYGGFYLDMDVHCLKSLDGLCERQLVLGVEKILSAEECARTGHKYPVRIANYMFGSRPRHAFWLSFLAAAEQVADAAICHESDILEVTGPGLLTNVYHANSLHYKDITLLSNPGRACLKSCGPSSCHFGNYAVHLHLGSWRWETNRPV